MFRQYFWWTTVLDFAFLYQISLFAAIGSWTARINVMVWILCAALVSGKVPNFHAYVTMLCVLQNEPQKYKIFWEFLYRFSLLKEYVRLY